MSTRLEPRASIGQQSLTPQRLMRFGGILLGLIAVLSAVALTSSRGQQASLNDSHTITEVRSNLQTADMMHDAIRAVVLGSGLEAQLGPEEIAVLRTELDENVVTFQEAIDTAIALPSTPEIAKLLQSTRVKVDAYGESSVALFGQLDDLTSTDPAMAAASGERYAAWVDAFEVLKVDMESLTETIGAESSRILEAGRSTGSRSNLMIMVASLVAVGVFVMVWRKVLRSVARSNVLQEETSRLTSMMENSPTNMMLCAPDMTIEYMNPASLNTLRGLQAYLPCKVDDIVGSSVDIFHNNPAHQRAILGNPDVKLPLKSQIQVGPETLELFITGIKNHAGDNTGAMLTWTVITQTLRNERETNDAQERERAATTDLQTKVDALSVTLARAAAGDLTAQVTVTGTDGIGQMGAAVAKLLGDLRASIQAIAANSEALAAAAEELQVVSAQMGQNSAETSRQVGFVSDASVEVSRNVETVSAASEEMSASIKEIARNAADAAKVATHAVEAAKVTNATVAQLGDSSTEIGQIVKVITGIAQQTNLLALNATIEAARAGEAGKGFAVVANEVKELAKETAKATEDISAKIEAIQNDTNSSVESITGILSIIEQIAEFQNTIASAVEQQAATTNEIARSVTDASRGSTEITANMDTVAKAADNTATGANDSSRAASELARMASDLQHLVSQFTY